MTEFVALNQNYILYLAQLTKKEREHIIQLTKTEEVRELLAGLSAKAFLRNLGDLNISFRHNNLCRENLVLDDDGIVRFSDGNTITVEDEIEKIPVRITVKVERK